MAVCIYCFDNGFWFLFLNLIRNVLLVFYFLFLFTSYRPADGGIPVLNTTFILFG